MQLGSAQVFVYRIILVLHCSNICNFRVVNIPVGKGIKRVEFHQSFAVVSIFYSWKYSADSNQENLIFQVGEADEKVSLFS